MGLALSSTLPEFWSIRRMTLAAWSGESKCSSSLTVRPSEYWISISRQELMSISSIPSAKMYLVRNPYSAISVYRASTSSLWLMPSTAMRLSCK